MKSTILLTHLQRIYRVKIPDDRIQSHMLPILKILTFLALTVIIIYSAPSSAEDRTNGPWLTKYNSINNSNSYHGPTFLLDPNTKWNIEIESNDVFGQVLLTGNVHQNNGTEIIIHRIHIESDNRTDYLLFLSGEDGTFLREIPLNGILCGEPGLLNINGDDYYEILYFDDLNLTLYYPSTNQQRIVYTSEWYIDTPISCVDIDHDDIIEVMFTSVNSYSDAKFIVLNSRNWETEWTVSFSKDPERGLYISQPPLFVDADGDGLYNIYITSGQKRGIFTYYGSERLLGINVSTRSIFWEYQADSIILTCPVLLGYRNNIEVIGFGTASDNVIAITKLSSVPLWNFEPPDSPFFSLNQLSVYDINGDGFTDVLCGDIYTTYIIDGADGDILWQRHNNRSEDIRCMIFVDVTSDVNPEIVLFSSEVTVIDLETNTTIFTLDVGPSVEFNLLIASDIDNDRLGELIVKINKKVSVIDSDFSVDEILFSINSNIIVNNTRYLILPKYQNYSFSLLFKGVGFHDYIEAIEFSFDNSRDEEVIIYDVKNNTTESPHFFLTLLNSTFLIKSDGRSSLFQMTIDFDWTFPHENPCSIGVKIILSNSQQFEYIVNNAYWVESNVSFSHPIALHANGTLVEENSWFSGYAAVELILPYPHYEGYPQSYLHAYHYTLKLTINGNVSSILAIEGQQTLHSLQIVRDSSELNISLQLSFVSYADEPMKSTSSVYHIDWDPVSFINPIPSTNSIIAESEVVVSILVTDGNGSGVDIGSIGVLITNESGAVKSYTPTDIQLLDGSIVSVSMIVPMQDGMYIVRWHAYDIVDNGPAYSSKLVIYVYTGNIAFANFTPVSWINVSKVNVSIDISFIEVFNGTIECSESSKKDTLGYEWSIVEWEKIDRLIRCRYSIKDLHTGEHFVQWRVHTSISERPVQSNIYSMQVDLDAPFIVNIPFHRGMILDNGMNSFELVVIDNNSGVDPSSVVFSLSRNQSNPNHEWKIIPGPISEDKYNLDILISEGSTNYLLLSCKDHAGNEFQTPMYAIIGNRNFTVQDILPRSGSRFQTGVPIFFSVNVTDPDGDNLKIEWYTQQMVLLSSLTNFSTTFREGEYSIEISITDNHGHYYLHSLNITIAGKDDPDPTNQQVHPHDYLIFLLLFTCIIIISYFIVYFRRKKS